MKTYESEPIVEGLYALGFDRYNAVHPYSWTEKDFPKTIIGKAASTADGRFIIVYIGDMPADGHFFLEKVILDPRTNEDAAKDCE